MSTLLAQANSHFTLLLVSDTLSAIIIIILFDILQYMTNFEQM